MLRFYISLEGVGKIPGLRAHVLFFFGGGGVCSRGRQGSGSRMGPPKVVNLQATRFPEKSRQELLQEAHAHEGGPRQPSDLERAWNSSEDPSAVLDRLTRAGSNDRVDLESTFQHACPRTHCPVPAVCCALTNVLTTSRCHTQSPSFHARVMSFPFFFCDCRVCCCHIPWVCVDVLLSTCHVKCPCPS